MPKDYVVTRHDQKQADEQGGPLLATKVAWANADQGGWVQLATVYKEDALDRGKHIDMDRESINRLIRVLRRARDGAFGADA